MPLRETRRILLDGNIVDVERHGEELVAGDGRTVGVDQAVHLAPVVPSKIICVHLNYSSRVQELMLSLPRHRPTSTTGVCAQRTRVGGRPTSRLQVVEL